MNDVQLTVHQKSRELAGALIFGVLLPCSSLSADVLFKDDFSSMGLSAKLGSAKWMTTTAGATTVSLSPNGTPAAKLTYKATPDLTADSDAELRFDLGQLYTTLWIQYDLYVPINYEHRETSPTNNKFFRLWGTDYSDNEKVGASTWRTASGTSSLRPDWVKAGQNSIGPKGQYDDDFITSADRGTWITVKIQIVGPSAEKLGSLRIWRNDVLVSDNLDAVNNFAPAETHAYKVGYLLGWSNSGYTSETVFYIDNVFFASSESDLPVKSLPPTAPVLEVQ